MTTYIALLRGINVGKHKRIKMADLRNTFERLGFHHVQTYIQSGNVLFKTAEETARLRIRIEQAIEEDFGFPVSVILRTAESLRAILLNCPFSKESLAKARESAVGEYLYVSMLTETVSQECLEKLVNCKSDQEAFHVAGKDIYLLFYQSIRNSKLANQLQKFNEPVTVRNWKTLSKLVVMADEMESAY